MQTAVKRKQSKVTFPRGPQKPEKIHSKLQLLEIPLIFMVLWGVVLIFYLQSLEHYQHVIINNGTYIYDILAFSIEIVLHL